MLVGKCRRVSSSLVILLCLPAARAPDQSVDEYKAAEIKAGYLRYIAEFTTWPVSVFEDGSSPIVFGFIGKDLHGIAHLLKTAIRQKRLKAQKRPIVLRELQNIPVLPEMVGELSHFEKEIRQCHLIFLSRSEGTRWSTAHALVADLPIVTVSDLEGFAMSGGVIELVVAAHERRPGEQSVYVHVNLEAGGRAGLRFSSRFLGLKRAVKIVKHEDGK